MTRSFNLPPGCSLSDIDRERPQICTNCGERLDGFIAFTDGAMLCGLCADDRQDKEDCKKSEEIDSMTGKDLGDTPEASAFFHARGLWHRGQVGRQLVWHALNRALMAAARIERTVERAVKEEAR